jgi:hypothetical protein
VDGQVILSAGEQLTGLQAHKRWLQHEKRMEFRCVSCQLPLIPVKVHNANWKRTPHFRAHDNEEHTHPCPYAGESQPHTGAPDTFEVADDKLDIPTKLVRKARRHPRAGADHTTVLASGEGGQREERHEEHTSYWVEALCYLNVAPKLWRSPIRIKKQWLAPTIRFSNRYPLRQRTFHLPAAYPRIDLASLLQQDPQRFWITGRLPLVYHK